MHIYIFILSYIDIVSKYTYEKFQKHIIQSSCSFSEVLGRNPASLGLHGRPLQSCQSETSMDAWEN